MPKSYQGRLRQLFSTRIEFPEWGKFKMSESGRFSMPYAMLAIMVTLFGIVIAAVVTIGLAVAGAAIWVVISVTEVKTTVNQMAKVQQTQETKIDGLKAYVQVQTREADKVQDLLNPAQQAKLEQWRRANPKPPFQNNNN